MGLSPVKIHIDRFSDKFTRAKARIPEFLMELLQEKKLFPKIRRSKKYIKIKKLGDYPDEKNLWN